MTHPTFSQAAAVVAGHICLDMIPMFQPDGPRSLVPGTLVDIAGTTRATGGAVANTGRALHRLGVPVLLVGKVGEDLFGSEILRLLDAEAPALTRGVQFVAGEQTAHSVVVNLPGVDRTFLHCRGANDSFGAADVPWDQLEGARLLHFGYPPIMRRMYQDDGAELVRLFREARRRGMAVSLDLCGIDPGSEAGQIDWPRWLHAVLPEVDIFLPSLDEVMQAMQRPAVKGGPAASTLADITEHLLAAGPAIVALKLGEHGLYLRSTSDQTRLAHVGTGFIPRVEAWRGRELFCPCFRAQVQGTTGAGDCTIAGFLAALLREATPEEAMRVACAVGASSTEAADAVGRVPSWEGILARLEGGWTQHPPIEEVARWKRSSMEVWAGPTDGGAD